MRCTEGRPPAGVGVGALLLTVAACAPPAPPNTPLTSPQAVTASAPAVASMPAPAAVAGRKPLAPPAPVRTMQQLRLQAAQRLVDASPDGSYTGAPPETLLAIPVLEIELNADGSVGRIEVLRQPRQARDTTQLAIDAVRRAAPFGDVSRLSKPWKFSETFLFDDERRFKPRTLEP